MKLNAQEAELYQRVVEHAFVASSNNGAPVDRAVAAAVAARTVIENRRNFENLFNNAAAPSEAPPVDIGKTVVEAIERGFERVRGMFPKQP